jgi:metallophosphoesterase superfamily enzyme
MATSKPSRAEIMPGVWLDSRRAIFIQPLRTLVVADLHWGFATTHRSAGALLPMWGDEEIGRSLRSLLAAYEPQEMIWVGDCVESYDGRVSAEQFLNEMAQTAVTTTVLAGNHDRRWNVPTGRTLQREKFFFHHGDKPCPALANGTIEVVGHFHPAANLWDGAGTRLRLPALVCSPTRLILPAFSPWSAGTAWNDRLQPSEILWAVAPSRVFAVRPPRTPSTAPPS